MPAPSWDRATRTLPRPPTSPARLAAILILVALGLSLGACGRKGPPLPPGARVPQPVSQFTGVIQDDGSVQLTWSSPRRRIDGGPLRDLARERLYRVEDAGTGEPKPALLSGGRVAGYAERLTIRFPLPPESAGAPPPVPPPLPEGVSVEGTRVRVSDRAGLVAGRRYTYVVIAEDSLGRESAPSARVSLMMISPAEPPAALAVQAGEGEVRLSWQPPARLADGGPVTGTLAYEVLRAPEPGAPLAAITPGPLTQPAFTDRGVANDHAYAYAVRSIRTEGATTVRGRPSPPVTATPRDVTPPAPPRGLTGIPSEGTVRLRWDASPDADVARYVVYRAQTEGGFARVGSVAPPDTGFVDRAVPRGLHRYAVTAVDHAATPNESRHSNEVSVSVP